jgi:hypothetical protein
VGGRGQAAALLAPSLHLEHLARRGTTVPTSGARLKQRAGRARQVSVLVSALGTKLSHTVVVTGKSTICFFSPPWHDCFFDCSFFSGLHCILIAY